jgi:hypothetical protein
MGIIVAVICFIIGIPVFLFGALIFTGLSIAGIIGSPVMIPAIIFASALLLVGAFLMFMGWRNIQEKKVMTVNANGLDPSNIKTSATKRNVSIAKGLVIVVVVAITLISAIAIGAAVIDPLLNQMSSDIDTDTDTTDDASTDETETVTNPDNTETTIAMEDSDFEPEETRVPLNDNIVWENHEDDPPHTATSGTGSDDPD